MVNLAAVTTALPVGIPLWALVLSLVLTGAAPVAVVQLLTARTAARAASRTVESSANLTDVQALSGTIASLAAENTRLVQRLAGSQALVDDLRVLLGTEPTKEQLMTVVEKLRAQVVDAGEVPVNGPPARP